MHRCILGAVVALTLAAGLSLAVPTPAAAAPGDCPRQTICVYPLNYYRGLTTAISGVAQWCRPLPRAVYGHVGSVVNNTTMSRGTLFEFDNCTGRSAIMHAQTWTGMFPGHWYNYRSIRVW